MMSANSFVFSQEGTDLFSNDQRNPPQIQDNDSGTYDHYERKKVDLEEIHYTTPRGDDNHHNYGNGNYNDDTESNDEASQDSSSMSDLDDEIDERRLNDNNNNNDRRRDTKSKSNKNTNYKYKPVAPNYWPNEIESLTKSKWGHYAELDKFINPWTLSFIGLHEILDKSEYYPQWINYKYESYNTAHMLLLASITMILASIHVSFTSFVFIK